MGVLNKMSCPVLHNKLVRFKYLVITISRGIIKAYNDIVIGALWRRVRLSPLPESSVTSGDFFRLKR